MILSWFVLALRCSIRDRLYSILNITGLSIGLTGSILVVSLLNADLHFDGFHEAGDRLFRVVGTRMPSPAMAASAAMIPQIEDVIRVAPPPGIAPPILRRGSQPFHETGLLYVDEGFLRSFTFPLVSGDPTTALADPGSIALTQAAARRYFGDSDPMGRALLLDATQRQHTVTAVLRDVPGKSHLQFEVLVPAISVEKLVSAGHQVMVTYVKLQSPGDRAAVERELTRIAMMADGRPAGEQSDPALQVALEPVGRVHLSSHPNPLGPTRSWRDLVLYGSVAAMLVLVACGNYVNLSLARSMRRVREVGVRKAMGASRVAVMGQHFAESALSVALAMAVSVGLAEISLPTFERVLGRSLEIQYSAHLLWAQLLGLGMLVALLAGSYPAVVQARRRAVWALAGEGAGTGKSLVRSGLVLTQFVATIGVLAMAGVTYLQLDYMRTKDIGFDTEDLLVTEARGINRVLYSKMEGLESALRLSVVKDALLKDSRVEAVSLTGRPPGHPRYPHMSYWAKGGDKTIPMPTNFADVDYLAVLGLELVAGRWYSEDFAGDREEGLVLNETAARQLGVAVGDLVATKIPALEKQQVPVIGIVRDSHYRSLYHRIPPQVFRQHPDASRISFLTHMIVRGVPGSGPDLAGAVEQAVAQVAPEAPFSYHFLDHVFSWEVLYEKEVRTAKILGGFAFLSGVVACLGLLGLAAYAAESRKREVAIRKVLGATTREVVLWLSGTYVRMVALASAVACPMAFYIGGQWLTSFPYRIELGPGVFGASALAVLVFAAATAGTQGLRAALANPVESLRQE